MTFPAATVFDMDGVLIESEAIWDEVRQSQAAAQSLPWPDEATAAMMGMSTQEWSAYLVDTVGMAGTPEQVAAQIIQGVADGYRDGLPVLPGAVAAVERAASWGPVGIASSSPRILIDLVVAELGIGQYLSATVSTEEVGAGKPAPDGYLKAAALLGIDPTTAVAVEDSTNGIKSAHAAGMAVVAVPPSFHPPAADTLALASAVIANLDEFTGDLVRQLR